jgi:hypothetical protein
METKEAIHGSWNFETTIDKKTERHTIVSDSKNPNSTLEYKWTDGRSSDSRIPVPLGVLEHNYVIRGNVLWIRPSTAGTVVLGLSHGNEAHKNSQKAKDVKDIAKHILYIPWFTGETTGGHWSLMVRYKNTHGKVAFYHIDSLNRFDNSESYILSNTPLYSQNRDSWHNLRTIRQKELECGIVLCLDASMIAQYRGTIPKRMKNYGDIDNLSIFAREYVVNILTLKKWTGIEHQKEKT